MDNYAPLFYEIGGNACSFKWNVCFKISAMKFDSRGILCHRESSGGGRSARCHFTDLTVGIRRIVTADVCFKMRASWEILRRPERAAPKTLDAGLWSSQLRSAWHPRGLRGWKACVRATAEGTQGRRRLARAQGRHTGPAALESTKQGTAPARPPSSPPTPPRASEPTSARHLPHANHLVQKPPQQRQQSVIRLHRSTTKGATEVTIDSRVWSGPRA